MFNIRLLPLRLGQISTTLPRRLWASQHKRRPRLGALPSEQLDQLKLNYFQRKDELSSEDCERVRDTLLDTYKYINPHNVDAVVLGLCSSGDQLPVAKSYVKYLESHGLNPNAATLGRLLRVYNAAYQMRALSEAEESEILQICDRLQGVHETLDASSCEHLIHGLVATSGRSWLQAVQLLEMMKLTSSPNISAYSALATKAFSSDEPNLAWRLLEEMLQHRKMPKCEVYLAQLDRAAQNPAQFGSELERLLRFLELHDILVTGKVAERLLELAQRMPDRLQVTHTRLEKAGKCVECQQHLEHVAITDEQFGQLRESFLEKVLIRNDVFQKSTPEEVANFKQYVAQTAPYDCVIDGLNVAYSTGNKKPPKQLANLLATVVRHFKERRKRVLVLGRQHMVNWSKPAMNYIRSNASVFLTNNLTHDDPFLLYATLRSGQDTDFFSRDLMRSHAYLLGSELKAIFRRWQQEHQYSLVTQTGTGQIIVKEPIRHRMSAHKVAGRWHVPCCDTYTPNPGESFDLPAKWLCLKIK